MLQDNFPIAFASRALTDCEKRYAPIERELTAILFAAEKFDYYNYGKQVIIQTDHKPLVNIFKKDLNKVSRVYQYELEVTYIQGKYMYVADTLSRAYLKNKVSDDPEITY